MKRVFIALLVALLPMSVSAAGFAKQSLFLSKSSVTEGDTVLIHTVVANETTTKFTGTLTWREEDTKLGSLPVTLAGQEAQALSISWKPKAGNHTITAELSASDGEIAEVQTASFAVAQKATGGGEQGDVVSSADIQQTLAGISPGVAQAAAPVFSTLDSVRGSAADLIDKGIDWTKVQGSGKKKSTVGSGSLVAGATTADSGGLGGTVMGIVSTIIYYILSALRYAIANPALFYPLFALLFFWILWKIYKRMRRPKYPELEG